MSLLRRLFGTRARRLVYAAHDRCRCGAGLAYDPQGESGNELRGYWACSAELLGTADPHGAHERRPFLFANLVSETQPGANGATTRPPAQRHPAR